jgi:hypothetical protein
MGGFRAIEDRPTPKEVYNWRLYSEATIIAFGSMLYVETVFKALSRKRWVDCEIADSVTTPPLLERPSPVQALKTTLVSPPRIQAPFQATLHLLFKPVLSLVHSSVTSVRIPLFQTVSDDSNRDT